jgi:hypothetical protein
MSGGSLEETSIVPVSEGYNPIVPLTTQEYNPKLSDDAIIETVFRSVDLSAVPPELLDNLYEKFDSAFQKVIADASQTGKIGDNAIEGKALESLRLSAISV